jgi:hypothetical protein
VVNHVGGSLIRAEHVLGAQRLGYRLIESGRGQALGQALPSAGDEPGRHRGLQQCRHQHRGALQGHIALAGQQDRRGVDVRPVGHAPGRPERRHRGGDLPAAPSPRQQIGHLLQRDRRQVPHLRPGQTRVHSISQVRAAPRAVAWRGQRFGPIRCHRRGQPRALAPRLPTGLAIGRPLPRRAIRPPLGLGRNRIRRRWNRGIGRITPQPGLQLSDPCLSPLQLRGQAHYQLRQLSIRRRLGPGHNPDDRRSSTHDRARHADTDHRQPTNSPATAQLNRTREWTRDNC